MIHIFIDIGVDAVGSIKERIELRCSGGAGGVQKQWGKTL
jgi:hypothetical protein